MLEESMHRIYFTDPLKCDGKLPNIVMKIYILNWSFMKSNTSIVST